MILDDLQSWLFSYKNVYDLFNKAETWLYLSGIVINFKNINLRFLFLLLFAFQLFDSHFLSAQMRTIKPFYMEYFVEALYSALACFLILCRAKIAGWVRYDSRYLGYMQEFGLFAVYVGFTLYSAILFLESFIYWHTELLITPLLLKSHRLYVYYSLQTVEFWILISLTVQNIKGTLPQRHSVKI